MELLSPPVGAQVEEAGGAPEEGLGDWEESGGELSYRLEHGSAAHAWESVGHIKLHPCPLRLCGRDNLHRVHESLCAAGASSAVLEPAHRLAQELPVLPDKCPRCELPEAFSPGHRPNPSSVLQKRGEFRFPQELDR